MFRFVWPGRFASGALGRPSRSGVINYTGLAQDWIRSHEAAHTTGKNFTFATLVVPYRSSRHVCNSASINSYECAELRKCRRDL